MKITNSANAVSMSSVEIMGQVYVVEFSDGWIKVGRGRNADARIKQHQSVSRMRGASLVRSFKSEALPNAGAVERALIALCSQSGEKVHGNEWFVGVSFESVVCAAQSAAAQSAAARVAECVPSRCANESQKERTESFLDRLFPGPTNEQIAWRAATTHALTLERVLLDDGFGGELFQDTGSGYSKFFLSASIAVYGMSPGELAETYSDALNFPGECIQMILEIARSAAAKYRAEVAA